MPDRPQSTAAACTPLRSAPAQPAERLLQLNSRAEEPTGERYRVLSQKRKRYGPHGHRGQTLLVQGSSLGSIHCTFSSSPHCHESHRGGTGSPLHPLRGMVRLRRGSTGGHSPRHRGGSISHSVGTHQGHTGSAGPKPSPKLGFALWVFSYPLFLKLSPQKFLLWLDEVSLP